MGKGRRKSGPLTNRQREARRLLRDRNIDRNLRYLERLSLRWHVLKKAQTEPLSVYAGIADHPHPTKLTAFPLTRKQINGAIPPWEDLTAWLKAQVLVMALHQWDLQTFTVHLHRDLERKWVANGDDPRVKLRDRLRKQMVRRLGQRREYFFVIEGWSKKRKSEVRLHIHGGAFIAESGDGPKIVAAVASACGQGSGGRSREPKAVHHKIYWKEGRAYINYLFKSVRRKDHRLDRRRVHMSQEATGAGREMWRLMTDPR